MLFIIVEIPHPMIAETSLPDQTAAEPKRKSSLDKLHGALKRNFRRGRQKHVDVVGHNDEFMQKKFSLVAIMRKRFDQKIGI